MLLPPAFRRRGSSMHDTVQSAKGHRIGKSKKPERIGVSCDGTDTTSRLHVTDRRTGWTFLVDTGADASIIPRTRHAGFSEEKTDFQLYAANGARIKTYGRKTLFLDLGLRRPIKWFFVVADVIRPVIGADLIKHFGLLVDLTGKRLVDKVTYLTVQGYCRESKHPTLMLLNPTDEYHQMLTEFPELTQPQRVKANAAHGIHHVIHTTGPPVACRPRRLPSEKLKLAKNEFADLMERGICRPSNSP